MQTLPERSSPLIFVAEDDAHIRELIVTRLVIAGYRTATAKDGAEAIRGIRESRPSAIILDINMPKASGFDVLSHLRTSRDLSSIPVLVLTARGAPEDVREALRLGARDYLTKPFDDRSFLMRISRLLRPPRVKTMADTEDVELL